ncbi:hypothetical protein IJ096_02710 [Candidatus Saccharibacteria bacterium]|nr:hypothetical protein [Candidatus Saccharibacteria bacterium]
MVKKRRTNLRIKRYKMIAFAFAVLVAILGGFMMTSINQPSIHVNAESTTSPVSDK